MGVVMDIGLPGWANRVLDGALWLVWCVVCEMGRRGFEDEGCRWGGAEFGMDVLGIFIEGARFRIIRNLAPCLYRSLPSEN